MTNIHNNQKRIRKYYGKIREVAEMPNLIEVQRSSYDIFLNSGDSEIPLNNEGIQGVFNSVFPIKDFNDTAVLEYVSYELEKPKYDVEECQQRDMTYSAPLKVKLRLVVFDIDEVTGSKSVKGIKEQDVYMGDIPLMTPTGTFVFNGTERVVVSQMHRSPGVFFDHDRGKSHSSGKILFTCRIIPYRGSWLDFEFDAKDLVYVRIDRRRKLPVSTMLYSLGMTQEDICREYYNTVTYVQSDNNNWSCPFFPERFRGIKPTFDVIDADTGEIIAPADKKVTPRLVKKLLEQNDMLGKWNDILVNAKWTHKDDGFFKIWINGKLTYEHRGKTLLKGDVIEYQLGIYRSFISRLPGPDPTQVVYYDELRYDRSCKKLKLEDLGYSCEEIESQN